jgi:TPP-dependent pyruvate/acetoin dehydrogenase alpha subunit
VKRYPLYDPPEYVAWQPDPALVAGFRTRLEADPARHKLVAALTREPLLELYRGLVRFRLHDIMLKRWVRQGVISKAWLGTGEEAVTIGAVHALDRKLDAVGPMIRNAGACHEMGMPLADMFRGYLGTLDSPTAGKDLHVGDLARGIITPISHVGSLVPVCAGIALSFRLTGRAGVALTWVGDGATRTAEFHEGMNFAAVRRLPFLAVVQDNRVALGTPVGVHTAADLRRTGEAYGVPSLVCDGNNVLDVWAATRIAAERARRGEGAAVIVAETFRMGGHATHDEAEGRQILAPEEFERWGRRDPIGLYEEHLAGTGVCDRAALAAAEAEIAEEVERAAAAALTSKETRMPRGPEALAGVYASG